MPERAIWLRTLLAEHTRILSHCGFLGYVPHRVPGDPGRALREDLRTQTLRLTGNRIHPMATRVGGLAVDADDAWLQAERQVATQAARVAERLLTMIDSPPFAGLTSGVGLLDHETTHPARQHGQRVDLDLRLQTPYLAYRELAGLITPRYAARAMPSRDWAFSLELAISASLIIACIDRLGELPGPVAVSWARSFACRRVRDTWRSRHRRGRVSGLPRREDPGDSSCGRRRSTTSPASSGCWSAYARRPGGNSPPSATWSGTSSSAS